MRHLISVKTIMVGRYLHQNKKIERSIAKLLNKVVSFTSLL